AGAFKFNYAQPKPLDLAVEAVDDRGRAVVTSATVFSALAVEIDHTTAPDWALRTPSLFQTLRPYVHERTDSGRNDGELFALHIGLRGRSLCPVSKLIKARRSILGSSILPRLNLSKGRGTVRSAGEKVRRQSG